MHTTTEAPIQLRNGERIRPSEYQPGHVEALNATLNEIAAEPDVTLNFVDRWLAANLDSALERGVKVFAVAVIGLTVFVVITQIAMGVS